MTALRTRNGALPTGESSARGDHDKSDASENDNEAAAVNGIDPSKWSRKKKVSAKKKKIAPKNSHAGEKVVVPKVPRQLIAVSKGGKKRGAAPSKTKTKQLVSQVIPGEKRRAALKVAEKWSLFLPQPPWYSTSKRKLSRRDDGEYDTRSPAARELMLRRHTLPGNVLPRSFGHDTAFTCFDTYLSKKEKGLGIKFKNMDEKAVVRGFANWLPGDELSTGTVKVHVNDVAVAVNNLDARSELFQDVVNKLKSIEEGQLICMRFARPVLSEKTGALSNYLERQAPSFHREQRGGRGGADPQHHHQQQQHLVWKGDRRDNDVTDRATTENIPQKQNMSDVT